MTALRHRPPCAIGRWRHSKPKAQKAKAPVIWLEIYCGWIALPSLYLFSLQYPTSITLHLLRTCYVRVTCVLRACSCVCSYSYLYGVSTT